MTGVLRGLVADHPEIVIVGESRGGGIDDAIGSTKPDVVVAGEMEHDDDTVAAILARHPSIRLVTIDHGGRRATLRRLHTAPEEVLEVSQATLLNMLRGVR